MGEIQFECLPLYGKRIFVVEDDDHLYCVLKDALQEAGGEIIGSLAHFPDMAPMVPNSHIDAALLDINWQDESAMTLARELEGRRIPMLLITNDISTELPLLLRAPWRIRKPFTEEELLDCMLTAVNRPDSTGLA